MNYLASPYSHWNALVRLWRWYQAVRLTAQLMRQGHLIYSPIVHNHWLAVLFGLPAGYEFWKRYDEAALLCCKELWIAPLPDWNKSVGIAREIEFARQNGIPVFILGEYSGAKYPYQQIDAINARSTRRRL